MPKMNFNYTLDINLERFVRECSDSELLELYILIDREIGQRENKLKFEKMGSRAEKRKLS